MLGAMMLMPKRMPAAVRMKTTPVDKNVCPERADEVAHDFFVVDQHEEKDQCWRHGEDRDYVDDENYVDQRQAGDEDDGGGGGGAESEHGVERFAFSHGKVEAVRFVGDFSEGVGGRGGDGDGGDDAGFDHAESEERSAEAADDGLESLGEFGGLEIVGGHLMSEERGGGEDGGEGGGGCERGAEDGVDAAEADVFGGHAFVDGGALLEEKHPGGDGGADVGEDDEESVFVEARERLPGDEGVADRVPAGVGHERDGNEDQIEHGGGEGDALPGPVAVAHQRAVEDHEGDEDGDPGTERRRSRGRRGWR